MAFANALTRIGVGGASPAYGAIGDKAAGVPPSGVPAVDGAPGKEGGIYAGYQRGKRLQEAIAKDDAEFLKMAQESLPEILKLLH